MGLRGKRPLFGASFSVKLLVSSSLVTFHRAKRPCPLGGLGDLESPGAPGLIGKHRVFSSLCSSWHGVPGVVPGRWHWQLVATGWGRRLDSASAKPLQDVPVPLVRPRDLQGRSQGFGGSS